MNRTYQFLLVSLFTVVVMIRQPSHAQMLVTTPLSIDHRIRSMLYVPDQVIRLRGWVGYHVDLQFEPGESFVTMGGGDLSALTFGHYENHLVLKPKAPTVQTNLTIYTNKRTYVIDYQVAAGRPDPINDELVYSLRFNYPAAPGATSPEQITQDLNKSPVARFQNLNYWFCGNPLLQPIGASDDGVHTRLRFSPSAELPAVFIQNDDGAESLLNYSMEGQDVVIHRTARRLILRRGKLVGCITNRGFTGSGERLDSGTVSPQVHRDTREISP